MKQDGGFIFSLNPTPFVLCLTMVMFDLVTTTIGLRFGFVETRIFGGVIWIELSVFLGVVFILQVLTNYLVTSWVRKLGTMLSYFIALLPLYAVINNLVILGR